MNILRKRKSALCLSLSALFLGLSALLIFISRQSGGFSLWYSKNIFPVFANTMGRLFSPLPFSVFEILIYLTVFAILYGAFRLIKNPGSRGRILLPSLGRFLQRLLLAISVLILLFTLTAGINYGKPALLDQLHQGKIAADEGQTASDGGQAATDSSGQYSEDELIALFRILVEDADRASETLGTVGSAPAVGAVESDETNENTRAGQATKSDHTSQAAQVQTTQSVQAIKAMKNLALRFPELSGYYPNPKSVLFSKGMSYLGITGIYSPFTLEANYNNDIPSFLIPFTMCHELAHLKSFMREEEANFIAYLACRNSSSIEFQYSGAVNALAYTLSALYKTVDLDLYQDLVAEIPEAVRLELINNQAYWKAHRKKITEISNKANDAYLKANAQSAGVKSYGLMVELLLEEYRLTPDASLPSPE